MATLGRNGRLIGPKTEASTFLRILEICGVRGILNFSWMIFILFDDAVEYLRYYFVLYIDTNNDLCRYFILRYIVSNNTVMSYAWVNNQIL